jgi:hypothetical protein
VAQETAFHVDTCTGTTYDSRLRLFDVNFGELANNDDSCGLQSEIDMVIQAGDYYVLVEAFSSTSGAYTLTTACDPTGSPPSASPIPPPPPPGDVCHDHDEVLVFLAAMGGVDLPADGACALVANVPAMNKMGLGLKDTGSLCDDPVYGFLVRLICPVSCGMEDDDEAIDYLVETYLPEYGDMINTCADASNYFSCGDEQYGEIIRRFCPCDCNSEILYWVGVGHDEEPAPMIL